MNHELNEFSSNTVIPFRTAESIFGIRLDFLISFLPMMIWSVYLFGFRSLAVVFICGFSGAVFNILFTLLFKKTIKNSLPSVSISGLYIGTMLSLLLPADVSLWIPPLGVLLSVILFNGVINRLPHIHIPPALGGFTLLLALFKTCITSPIQTVTNISDNTELWTSATPLQLLGSSDASDAVSHNISNSQLFDMFIGYENGTIGEISVFMIVIGTVYLLFRKRIRIQVMLAYLVTIFALTFLFPANGFPMMELNYSLAHIFSGGAFFASVYFVGIPENCPITKTGKLIFGIGCGALTVLFRYLLGSEGIAYAVLIMCLLRKPIEALTLPHKTKDKTKKRTSA